MYVSGKEPIKPVLPKKNSETSGPRRATEVPQRNSQGWIGRGKTLDSTPSLDSIPLRPPAVAWPFPALLVQVGPPRAHNSSAIRTRRRRPHTCGPACPRARSRPAEASSSSVSRSRTNGQRKMPKIWLAGTATRGRRPPWWIRRECTNTARAVSGVVLLRRSRRPFAVLGRIGKANKPCMHARSRRQRHAHRRDCHAWCIRIARSMSSSSAARTLYGARVRVSL